MGVLRIFLNKKENEKTKDAIFHSNVVSTIKNENQRIEKRLSACMREIQQSMAKKRKIKDCGGINKIMVKTFIRPVTT